MPGTVDNMKLVLHREMKDYMDQLMKGVQEAIAKGCAAAFTRSFTPASATSTQPRWLRSLVKLLCRYRPRVHLPPPWDTLLQFGATAAMDLVTCRMFAPVHEHTLFQRMAAILVLLMLRRTLMRVLFWVTKSTPTMIMKDFVTLRYEVSWCLFYWSIYCYTSCCP